MLKYNCLQRDDNLNIKSFNVVGNVGQCSVIGKRKIRIE